MASAVSYDAFLAVGEEAKIAISSMGLKVQMVDAANVAMVFLDAPATSFDFFEADAGEIALDVGRLQTLSSGKDVVTLKLDPETHKLSISTGKASYTMGLIDPTVIKAPPKIPQLDLPATIVMAGGDFQDAVKSASKVSDHLVLSQGEDAFTVSAKGDIDSVNIAFPLIELKGIQQGESRALFSLDYMAKIAKVAASASELTISTGIDYPGMLSFALNGISIRYMVAPRIERDD